tara:strand:+ start:2196 stop:3125 length:930 start_codon:yes stop_codon:yes gene_type:complete
MKLKKPKFWDYKKPNIYAYILYPISFLIEIITSLIKIKPKKFKIKTICIGNIYLGGTGKTSLCIKIGQILKNKNIKSCFVKKFYKNQIDEQKLLKKNGKLFLSSNRIQAISEAEYQNYDVAIIDDGLQDKSIHYDTRIVCFNNINWIGNGMTIPSGPLRENINKIKKYNHVFLNGNLENLEEIKNQIIKINPKISIHLGKYEPTNLNEFEKDREYIVFSGIGNHKTFISMLKIYGFKISKDHEFPDHYNYSNYDIENILREANNLGYNILTTEKDYIRLNKKYLNKIKFIRTELKIIDENKFLNFIIDK